MAMLAVSSVDDMAVATATQMLFRSLGSVMGVSVSSLVLQNFLPVYLDKYVSGPDRASVIEDARKSVELISTFAPRYREQVIDAYARSLHYTFAQGAITCDVELNSLEPNAAIPEQHDDASNESVAESLFVPVTKTAQLIVIISSFLIIVITIGLNQTYGVFLEYYLNPTPGDEDFLPPSQGQSEALLAFIGTIGQGLTWGGSIFVNPLMARCRDLRRITLAGAVLLGMGYTLAGSARSVWQLLLTQGVLYGMGSSMLYFPVLSVAPEYFTNHRGSAMGIILSGAGVGGLLYAPVTRVLLSRLGIRWTLRTLGLSSFAIALPIALSVRPSRSTVRRPTLVNVSLAKKPTFILQALAAMAQAAGNLVPLTFLPDFSTRLGYTAAFGAALLAINNGINSVSRILMGFIADVVVALWLGAAADDGKTLWIIFVVAYGIFAGEMSRKVSQPSGKKAFCDSLISGLAAGLLEQCS
ncbi:MAG: hypothetical protein Q9160_006791 [Pyrenula sp. 1 TL-2023]